MRFNEKLIILRKKNNLSQETLGEKLDVARQTVSKWELAETTPEMDKLIKLSEIFEISLDELVKDKETSDMQYELNDSNTQKLAGLIIKILKIVAISCLVLLIIMLMITMIGAVSFNKVTTDVTEVVKEQDEFME